MKFNLLGVTSLLFWNVFLMAFNRGDTNGSQQKGCDSGLYRSVDLFNTCIECPVSCDSQHEDDKEPCKNACVKMKSTPKPLIPQIQKATTSSSAGTTPKYFTPKSLSNKTTTSDKKKENPGLTLAIIIGVLVFFCLFIIIVVVCLVRPSRNTVVDLKSNEEEAVGMCPRHSSLSAKSSHQESVDHISETEIINTVDMVVSTEDCSSIMDLGESHF